MTSQELYEIVRREIDIRASLDPAFRFSQQQLDKGNGDFTNSDQCSQILSTILGKELAKHILEIGVGEGRSEVCQQLLKDHFDKVSRNFERAQSIQDRGKGIDLGTVTPEFPAERAKQVGDSLDDTTVSDETIQRRCQGAVTNVAKSMHDSFVKENARVRNDLGLKPIIQRFGTAPCAWCADVAGKYRYGEQPDDIFRRHDNCNCTIIYDTQVLRGAKTESGGRSKTWTEIDPKEIEDNAFNPTTFTQEQARQMEQNQLGQITQFTPQQAQNLSLTTGRNGGTISSGGNNGNPPSNSSGSKEPSEEYKAIVSAFTSMTSSNDIVGTVVENHMGLGEFSPQSMKDMLENAGYETKPLNKSATWKGVPFEQGGGYKITFGGDGYFQYHPEEGSHHKGAYWRVSNGKYGDNRYNMDGTIQDG